MKVLDIAHRTQIRNLRVSGSLDLSFFKVRTMQKNDTIVNSISVKKLIETWKKRYVIDLSMASLQEIRLSVPEIIELTSKDGRAKTAIKLQRIIRINSEVAGIKTDVLFSYIPNVVNLSETQRLDQIILKVYDKMIEIYQQQLSYPNLQDQLYQPFFRLGNRFRESDRLLVEFPPIEQLATGIQPILQELFDEHKSTSNPRALGFLSTQFHFTTELLTKRLTPGEQFLLTPYFNFIEEQVCIPFQRVCYAADRHNIGSPSLSIVEQLLPVSRDIAVNVYNQAVELYPNHHSRRGKLNHSGVMASTLRDLEMLQVYLWLCVLEENMTAIEKELIPLCIMVFPSVEVTWNLVKQMLKLLLEEILVRVEPNRQSILLPYTQTMQQIFSNIDRKLS